MMFFSSDRNPADKSSWEGPASETIEQEANAVQEPEFRIPRREFLKRAVALGGATLALSGLRLEAFATAPQTPDKPLPAPQKTPPAKTVALAKATPGKPAKSSAMQHPVRPYNPQESIQAHTFPNLTTVEGISQNQLDQHIGLYNGYVKKINEIEAQIANASDEMLNQANATYSPFRELHYEQTYALNGVILHEYYFEALGGAPKPPTETQLFHPTIVKEFGSWDRYINQLKAVAKSARGWALTGYNMRDRRIHNYALDLHNQAVPVNVIPLVVLDVYEHAYMIDFGTRRPAYLDAFFRNINWQVADERLKTMMFHA